MLRSGLAREELLKFQTHSKFVSIYTPGGQPTKMYCDHGPQLLAAATNMNWEVYKVRLDVRRQNRCSPQKRAVGEMVSQKRT